MNHSLLAREQSRRFLMCHLLIQCSGGEEDHCTDVSALSSILLYAKKMGGVLNEMFMGG